MGQSGIRLPGPWTLDPCPVSALSLAPLPDGDTDWVEFEVVTCPDRPDLDEEAAAAFRERC